MTRLGTAHIGLVVLATMVLAAPGTAHAQETISATVTRVIDGDTIEVVDTNATTTTGCSVR